MIVSDPPRRASLFSDRIRACLSVPGNDSRSEIIVEDGMMRAEKSGETFPVIDGVPSLYRPPSGDGQPITEKVKSFYEDHPFPGYEGLEEFGELANKGFSNPFSRQLLDAIGFNKLVLECGCGTGQLSHFLQLNNNHVLGIDMSLASLKLAVEHKNRNQLVRSSFCQMDIFDLAIRDACFDVVISHGVLHHTHDARRAFGAIARKLKPDGIIMVGLYNSYARIPTWLRARLIGLTGGKIDYVVRNRIRDTQKADIWIKDQYYNPHETWHSIDEVLGWFDEFGFEFVNCSPPIMGTDGEITPELFTNADPGTHYQRIVTQLGWLATIAREGALFDVIGRRRA